MVPVIGEECGNYHQRGEHIGWAICSQGGEGAGTVTGGRFPDLGLYQMTSVSMRCLTAQCPLALSTSP